MQYKEEYIRFLKEPVFRHGKVAPRYWGVTGFEEFKEYDIHQSKLTDNTDDIWFISDHHFNHKNVIEFANRPFVDIQEMENVLVDNHNDNVKEDDIVILVGDFGFCNKTEGQRILSRLNGYKILVMGNHDVYHGKFKDFGYKEVYISLGLIYNNEKVVITHYPTIFKDDILNIHGHIHSGSILDDTYKNHYNVNCEFIGYTPININTILKGITDVRITCY